MFNKYIKLVIAALITAWAVYEFSKGHIMNGISIVLLGLEPPFEEEVRSCVVEMR